MFCEWWAWAYYIFDAICKPVYGRVPPWKYQMLHDLPDEFNSRGMTETSSTRDSAALKKNKWCTGAAEHERNAKRLRNNSSMREEFFNLNISYNIYLLQSAPGSIEQFIKACTWIVAFRFESCSRAEYRSLECWMNVTRGKCKKKWNCFSEHNSYTTTAFPLH